MKITCPRCRLSFAYRGPSYSRSEAREDATRHGYPNAFKVWTPEEDQALIRMVSEGLSDLKIAEALGRQPGAIFARRKKYLPQTGEPQDTESQPMVAELDNLP